MTLLLDTHTFLWFGAADSHLSRQAREAIEAARVPVVISIASLWEITIKVSLGKLKLDVSISEMIESASAQRIVTLPISPKHLIAYAELPLHHRDPFDRMLIAQALTEDLQVVSRDHAFDAYGIKRIW